MNTTVETVIEVRCPVGPQRMFAQLRLGQARVRQPGNIIEFACADCRTRIRRERGHNIGRVLHRYDFCGDLIETVVCQSSSSG